MIKHSFHVTGTHCASCKLLIEDTLSNLKIIEKCDVDLKKETVNIYTKKSISTETLMKLCSEKITAYNYYLFSGKPNTTPISDDVTWKAILIGLSVLALFFLLQRSGILNFGLGGQVTPVTGLLIGLIASVSSCLAVVGGLVLSISAKISQDNASDSKAFLFFHSSRIISFALLGGLLGAVGSFIGINFTISSILGLIASIVMIILGLSLLEIITKKNLTLPSGIFSFIKNIEQKPYTPLILGFSTFFLPCGFTQSMQVSALSSGSFLTGMLIMLSFALGTLPVLLILTYGSNSISRSKYSTLFFKSAGVVVIGLGIFALLAGLAGLGIIKPLFSI